MALVPARRDAARLRALLWGEAGGGKSYTALLLLSRLVAARLGRPELVLREEGGALRVHPDLEKHIAVIDGEGRLREYAEGCPFYFLVEEPQSFDEQTLREIFGEIAASGTVLGVLVDPYSHAWQGPGGALDQHGRSTERDSFRAWGPVKASYRRTTQGLLNLPCDVVATARSKVERTLEGKTLVTHGLSPIGEDGLEYEFSLVARMSAGGTMLITKSPLAECPPGAELHQPDGALLEPLLRWLAPGSRSTYATLLDDARRVSTPQEGAAWRDRYQQAAATGALTQRETALLAGVLDGLRQRLAPAKS